MEPPQDVRPFFVAAGWRSGRRVPVNQVVHVRHPAYDILAQYGGLHVVPRDPGIECATSELKIEYCEAYPDEVDIWSKLLGSTLFGIADIDNGYGWLLIDKAGRCFRMCGFDDAFSFVGASFYEAIERLLHGRKARPMLRPDQDQVGLYGETFARGHPEIFEYHR